MDGNQSVPLDSKEIWKYVGLYEPGVRDKLWMEEKDYYYLTRLGREGTLLETEPNALSEIAPDHKYRPQIILVFDKAKENLRQQEETKQRLEQQHALLAAQQEAREKNFNANTL